MMQDAATKRTQRPRLMRQVQPVLKRRVGYMCDADEGTGVSKKLNTGMVPMQS